VRGSGRQTRPAGWNPYDLGGLGIIPRRDVADPGFLLTRYALGNFASGSPLRLLALMRSVHPGLAQAVDNTLGLLCPPDGLRIVAVRPSRPGEGDEGTDDGGTAALGAFWESLPNEIAGLDGLLTTSLLSLLFTGMTCVEAVPARRMAGLARLWPVDALTIVFGRDDPDGGCVAYQKQTGAPRGYQRLDPRTFYWRPVDGDADNPYGCARLGAFLSQGLAALSLNQMLRDAFRHIAWPRLKMGIDYESLWAIALDRLQLNEDEANAWVLARVDELQRRTETLKEDDVILHDQKGSADVIEGGKGFENNEGVLERFDRHEAQSLKTRPVLVGINDSTTETQATVQWQIEGKTLERLRAAAVAPLLWAANLHFRLLGLALTARAEYETIRTSDALVEANTEAVRIANEVEKIRLGWISMEQASVAITGTGPVAEPLPGVLDPPAAGGAAGTPDVPPAEESDPAKTPTKGD